MANSKANSSHVEMDDIKEQFLSLRDDMKNLTELVAGGVAEQSGVAKDAALEKADVLKREAIKKASDLHAEAKSSITANPIAAVALFAGLGFVLGALLRK